MCSRFSSRVSVSSSVNSVGGGEAVLSWSWEEIAAWLEEIGMQQYQVGPHQMKVGQSCELNVSSTSPAAGLVSRARGGEWENSSTPGRGPLEGDGRGQSGASPRAELQDQGAEEDSWTGSLQGWGGHRESN